MELFGTKGRLWHPGDSSDPPLLVQDEEGGWRPVPLDRDAGSDSRANVIPQSYRAFAQTVRNGIYHPLCAENALRGFEVAMAIYESARLQTRIDFPLTQTRFPLDIMAEAGEV